MSEITLKLFERAQVSDPKTGEIIELSVYIEPMTQRPFAVDPKMIALAGGKIRSPIDSSITLVLTDTADGVKSHYSGGPPALSVEELVKKCMALQDEVETLTKGLVHNGCEIAICEDNIKWVRNTRAEIAEAEAMALRKAGIHAAKEG
jgi:hypothetical protein